MDGGIELCREDQAVAAYVEGASVRKVRRDYGISRQRLERALDARGVKRRPAGGAPLRKRKCAWCGEYPGHNRVFCNDNHRHLEVQDGIKKRLKRITDLLDAGLTRADIMIKLQMPKERLDGAIYRARKNGLLPPKKSKSEARRLAA